MGVTYVEEEMSKSTARKLLEHLDDYLKPDALVCVEELLTLGDELPRALPSDFLYQMENCEPVTTSWEIGVRKVWSSVLGCEELSLFKNSHFFEIGGTSLLVGRVASELRQVLGVSVP